MSFGHIKRTHRNVNVLSADKFGHTRKFAEAPTFWIFINLETVEKSEAKISNKCYSETVSNVTKTTRKISKQIWKKRFPLKFEWVSILYEKWTFVSL